ncbi:MAG: phosphoserine phosphatase [Candidatus Sumerlaeia bacterium]
MGQQTKELEHALVTTFGADRPGIVEEVSAWILEQGGNIADSRMARLGGEFATLILVNGAAGLRDRLAATREAFERRHQLTVLVKPVPPVPPAPAVPVLHYTLRATALDHPGIVHQVAALLRSRLINITAAETHTTLAPFTGTPVFNFEMELDIPADVQPGALREELRALGDREHIDFTLAPAGTQNRL